MRALCCPSSLPPGHGHRSTSRDRRTQQCSFPQSRLGAFSPRREAAGAADGRPTPSAAPPLGALMAAARSPSQLSPSPPPCCPPAAAPPPGAGWDRDRGWVRDRIPVPQRAAVPVRAASPSTRCGGCGSGHGGWAGAAGPGSPRLRGL